MSFSDVLAIVGILVTIVGFWIAIVQLRKTASSAEATKDAIVAANRRMLLNHLLVLAPQLVTLEAEIDAAIAVDDRKSAIRALVAFSHAAIQISALLESDSEATHTDLAKELRTAAARSTAAKAGLVSGNKGTLNLLLKNVSPLIASASSRCAGLTTTYQIKVA